MLISNHDGHPSGIFYLSAAERQGSTPATRLMAAYFSFTARTGRPATGRGLQFVSVPCS